MQIGLGNAPVKQPTATSVKPNPRYMDQATWRKEMAVVPSATASQNMGDLPVAPHTGLSFLFLLMAQISLMSITSTEDTPIKPHQYKNNIERKCKHLSPFSHSIDP